MTVILLSSVKSVEVYQPSKMQPSFERLGSVIVLFREYSCLREGSDESSAIEIPSGRLPSEDGSGVLPM